MAKTFKISILAADKVFYEGECESAVIPTSKGQYGLLAFHCNLFGAIIPGELKVKLPGQDKFEIASVSSGLFKMEENELLILVDSIERPEEIDINRAKRAAESAREALLHKLSRQEYYVNQTQLARAINRMKVKASFSENLK